MIDRKQLLDDLKPLLKALEADLRARCDEVPQIDGDLKKEYEQARAADRTGATFEEWRADLITQVAAAWILSCVFVRFLEDNGLISPPRISGPLHGAGDGRGMQRARDERDLYFKSHPKDTDRDYLLTVFDDLAKLPGTKDVFGPHNPVSAYRNWLSGDAGQKLIEFFQKIDTDGTGEIIHDFTDLNWDTRFLGDLYQDLSEAARKKYALLQTPVFVEEFILDRTLEPAIAEFGLAGFKMIDPACGSGHFVLGSFARILARWRRQEPGTPDRELVNRSLAALHGVDLNPYAIAIARFRLLVAAMRECHITKLRDAPAFAFNLVCGDSLLHGSPGSEQQVLGFHELAHAYQSEDLPELQRILQPGGYHAVVANPPYITVKDKALNQAYREHYPEVCHRQYSVAVPFMQRLFVLACEGGYTGQITANSFMKREFGKKLVESYLPKIDLTHMIDTSGAYIPGHGTPTVILFGRQRRPVAPTLRAVMGIKGEPATPDDPAKGQVWSAILDQIDRVGSQSVFVSVSDTPCEQFGKHPWSIGGGGAAELKEALDERGEKKLGDVADEIGRTTVVGEDDVWIMVATSGARLGIGQRMVPLVVGDCVRDWWTLDLPHVLYPYLSLGGEPIPSTDYAVRRYLVPFRSSLNARSVFGKTMADNGRDWWEHLEHYADKLRTPLSIVFAFVATHNHFVLDRGGKVFNRSAPVIKLPADATEDDHLGLLGLLSSSTACFWMKQIFHNKGSSVDGAGARQRTAPFEDFWEHDGTKLKQFPLPTERPLTLAKQIDALARQRAALLPRALLAAGGIWPSGLAANPSGVVENAVLASERVSHSMERMTHSTGWTTHSQGRTAHSTKRLAHSQEPLANSKERMTGSPERMTPALAGKTRSMAGSIDLGSAGLAGLLAGARAQAELLLARMIALQEELDWQCYGLYRLIEPSRLGAFGFENPPPLKLGQRAFEMVLARRLAAGEEESSWFTRHGSTPIATPLAHWPEDYRQVVERRIELIARDKNIALIERPEYKRRWNIEPWDVQQERALREWLLDRLESAFDLDGRMNDAKRVTTQGDLQTPRLTSVAKVADLARRAPEFVQVAELYAGRMDFDVANLVGELIAAESVPALPVLRYKPSGVDKRRAWERTWDLQRLEDVVDALFEELTAKARRREEVKLSHDIPSSLRDFVVKEIEQAAGYVAEAVKQKLDLTNELILKPVTDAAKRAKKTAVGDIPVPPKYTNADYVSSNYWRLRGKLDVPKERWVSFSHCEGEDGTLVIAWAGYDHLQLARAIAERYELAKEREGRKLVPLLAAIGQLIPWLKQWHNDLDPTFNQRMGDYFESYLAEEAKALDKSVEEVMAWTPPEKPRKTRKVTAKARRREEEKSE